MSFWQRWRQRRRERHESPWAYDWGRHRDSRPLGILRDTEDRLRNPEAGLPTYKRKPSKRRSR